MLSFRFAARKVAVPMENMEDSVATSLAYSYTF